MVLASYLATPSLVFALPQGGVVTHGQANMDYNGSNLNIHQLTDRAVINWEGFNISAHEMAQFIQPGSSSAVLNRVVGGSISDIQGALKANGNVFVINPNGIVIGANAVIDVNSFVGSTKDLDNNEFMNGGDLNFKGNSDAGIVNHGTIKASGGDIFLIARTIENTGKLEAKNGTVGAAATDGNVLLKSAGTERLFIQTETGKKLADGQIALDNKGVIESINAELKAYSGNPYAMAIKNSGRISATDITQKGGRILLQAVGKDETVINSGVLEAKGTKGGEIKVLGDKVGLTENAVVDASGKNGGGKINIGGGFQGKDDSIQNATITYVGKDVQIKADAEESGNGGDIVVWADDTTRFAATVTAKGGLLAGNGGNVEVSGKRHLDFQGKVDLTAVNGEIGTLLLDPTTIYINDNPTDSIAFTGVNPVFAAGSGISTINATDLVNALQTASIVIHTSGTGGNGNIYVQSNLEFGQSGAVGSLALLAHNHIVIGSASTTDFVYIDAGGTSITLIAGWDGDLSSTGINSKSQYGNNGGSVYLGLDELGNDFQYGALIVGNLVNIYGHDLVIAGNDGKNGVFGNNLFVALNNDLIIKHTDVADIRLGARTGDAHINVERNFIVNSTIHSTSIFADGRNTIRVGNDFIVDGDRAPVDIIGGKGLDITVGNDFKVGLNSGADINISANVDPSYSSFLKIAVLNDFIVEALSSVVSIGNSIQNTLIMSGGSIDFSGNTYVYGGGNGSGVTMVASGDITLSRPIDTAGGKGGGGGFIYVEADGEGFKLSEFSTDFFVPTSLNVTKVTESDGFGGFKVSTGGAYTALNTSFSDLQDLSGIYFLTQNENIFLKSADKFLDGSDVKLTLGTGFNELDILTENGEIVVGQYDAGKASGAFAEIYISQTAGDTPKLTNTPGLNPSKNGLQSKLGRITVEATKGIEILRSVFSVDGVVSVSLRDNNTSGDILIGYDKSGKVSDSHVDVASGSQETWVLNENGNIFVGSEDGIYAATIGNGHEEVGRQGGNIYVTALTGDIHVTGGKGSRGHAQIGHGTFASGIIPQDFADIFVNARNGSVNVIGGSGAANYALIGHVPSMTRGLQPQGGGVEVNAGYNINIFGGSDVDAGAAIIGRTFVNVISQGNIDMLGGTDDGARAAIISGNGMVVFAADTLTMDAGLNGQNTGAIIESLGNGFTPFQDQYVFAGRMNLATRTDGYQTTDGLVEIIKRYRDGSVPYPLGGQYIGTFGDMNIGGGNRGLGVSIQAEGNQHIMVQGDLNVQAADGQVVLINAHSQIDLIGNHVTGNQLIEVVGNATFAANDDPATVGQGAVVFLGAVGKDIVGTSTIKSTGNVTFDNGNGGLGIAGFAVMPLFNNTSDILGSVIIQASGDITLSSGFSTEISAPVTGWTDALQVTGKNLHQDAFIAIVADMGFDAGNALFGSFTPPVSPNPFAPVTKAKDGMGGVKVNTGHLNSGIEIKTSSGSIFVFSADKNTDGTWANLNVNDKSVNGAMSLTTDGMGKADGDISVAGFHDIEINNLTWGKNVLYAAWNDLTINATGRVLGSEKVTIIVDEQSGAAAGSGWFRNFNNVDGVDTLNPNKDIAIYAVTGPGAEAGFDAGPSQVILGNLAGLVESWDAAPYGGSSLNHKFNTSYQQGGAYHPVAHGTGYQAYLAGNGLTGSPVIWYKQILNILNPVIDEPSTVADAKGSEIFVVNDELDEILRGRDGEDQIEWVWKKKFGVKYSERYLTEKAIQEVQFKNSQQMVNLFLDKSAAFSNTDLYISRGATKAQMRAQRETSMGISQ